MVALNQLVTVRDTLAPACIDRYDMYPILPLYVTPAAGASTAAAWSKCKAATADARTELGLSNDYRLQWLSSAPEPGR
jgi:multidrug efflux pump subunit AcrB